MSGKHGYGKGGRYGGDGTGKGRGKGGPQPKKAAAAAAAGGRLMEARFVADGGVVRESNDGAWREFWKRKPTVVGIDTVSWKAIC